ATGVLANDTDAEHDPITAVRKTDPAHGFLVLNDDGSFSYVPDTDFRGKDSFTYVAHDLDGDSTPATVTIQVGKVPVVKDHTYTLPRDSSTLVVDASPGL